MTFVIMKQNQSLENSGTNIRIDAECLATEEKRRLRSRNWECYFSNRCSSAAVCDWINGWLLNNRALRLMRKATLNVPELF